MVLMWMCLPPFTIMGQSSGVNLAIELSPDHTAVTFRCNIVTLCGGTHCRTLGFKLHREYIDFPFCDILGLTMKMS